MVSLFIEHGLWFDENFTFSRLTNDDLDLICSKIILRDGSVRRGRQIQFRQLPRQVRRHNVRSIFAAVELRRRLKRRYRDKQVNIGYLPDGREFVLTFPRREALVHHVSNLPHLDDLLRTEATPENSSLSESSSEVEWIFSEPSSDCDIEPPEVEQIREVIIIDDSSEDEPLTPIASPSRRRGKFFQTPSTRASP